MAGGGSEQQTTSATRLRRDGSPLAISMCLLFKLYHEPLYEWLCVESTCTGLCLVVESLICIYFCCDVIASKFIVMQKKIDLLYCHMHII